jgi:hypothetical protein
MSTYPLKSLWPGAPNICGVEVWWAFGESRGSVGFWIDALTRSSSPGWRPR